MKKIVFSMLFLMASVGVFAQNYIRHTVVKDDTVTSLARKYSVTVHDIYTLNNEAKNGIKLGEVLIIPVNPKNAKFAKTKGTYHLVESKETLFGIAQKYGITIQAIQDANKEILENGLQPGTELLIPTGKKAENTSTIMQHDKIVHVVQPKETKFALIQKYGVSEEELILQNPQLKEGLKAGDTLRIAIKKAENNEELNSDFLFKTLENKEFKKLKINNTDKKEVVIMLPFRASRIANAQESFKTDRFLNITVDFYSGMMMAIEEIKKMGGNFNITIYDSEEINSNTSSVEHLIKTHDFSNVDLVIGPFFQSHAEKTAAALESKGVLVVSPLSTEGTASYKNLYLATPSYEITKKLMLKYLQEKNQNTIAIVDPKKASSKDFISQNYNGVRFVSLNEKGEIIPESLSALLDTDQTNYVILETESTSMVLNTVNKLSKLQETYDIVLVTLDKNDAFESHEIRSQALANLNLHYPSSLNESTTEQLSDFYTQYRALNKVLPNVPAIKGYDVTYDVLLRLSQNSDFEETAEKVATQQQESKFIYVKSPQGGYYNTGAYILYYDKDLTIKEAK